MNRKIYPQSLSSQFDSKLMIPTDSSMLVNLITHSGCNYYPDKGLAKYLETQAQVKQNYYKQRRARAN